MTALLLASGTAVMWGIDAFLIKAIIDRYATDVWVLLTIKLLVLALVGAVLLPFVWPRLTRLKNASEVVLYAALSAVALAGGEVLLLLAFERTAAPTIVTAIAYCSPVVAALLFVLVLKEKLSLTTVLGVVVTLSGMVLLASSHG